MKKNILLGAFITGGVFTFSLAEAAVTTEGVCAKANMDSLSGIINSVSCGLMTTVIPFLFSLAAAAFIWGIIQFYMNPENEEKRKKGKSFIVGGLIALFVMTSMWGIVRIFSASFGVKTVIPTFDNIESNN